MSILRAVVATVEEEEDFRSCTALSSLRGTMMGSDSILVCSLRHVLIKCKSEVLVELQIALIVKIVPSEHGRPNGQATMGVRSP